MERFKVGDPVGPTHSFLFGGCNIGTGRRLLEPVVKVEVWMAAGNIAQDHEEGVVGASETQARSAWPSLLCAPSAS